VELTFPDLPATTEWQSAIILRTSQSPSHGRFRSKATRDRCSRCTKRSPKGETRDRVVIVNAGQAAAAAINFAGVSNRTHQCWPLEGRRAWLKKGLSVRQYRTSIELEASLVSVEYQTLIRMTIGHLEVRRSGKRFVRRSQASAQLWTVLVIMTLHSLSGTASADAATAWTKQHDTQTVLSSEAEPLAQPKSPQQTGVPAEATRAAIPSDNPQTSAKIALGQEAVLRTSLIGRRDCRLQQLP
jgi:hypothetical protein